MFTVSRSCEGFIGGGYRGSNVLNCLIVDHIDVNWNCTSSGVYCVGYVFN